ncbi:MAG: hypothetical protein WA978_09510 [Sphingopyxis granuli]|uniref:hypothetical protein n=1 Tax=Sphingopyxis granuli TaxID=267128 RepID=UPI003C740DE0
MTLMLILGGVAIVYCLLLLFRCAKYALPLFAGLALAFYLRDQGSGWMTILAAGLLAGFSVHAFGRYVAGSSAAFAIRICVILLFAGTAAAAGYQAGGALVELAGLDPWADRGMSILVALLTGVASWRDLVPPGNPIARGELHA